MDVYRRFDIANMELRSYQEQASMNKKVSTILIPFRKLLNVSLSQNVSHGKITLVRDGKVLGYKNATSNLNFQSVYNLNEPFRSR